MALYLVQHGMNAARETDPEKGLTELGKAETRRMAEVAKGYNVRVTKIVHSGKKRAEQTAALFHDILLLETPLVKVGGINPKDDVRPFAKGLSSRENIMVVGHLPFLQRLVSYLITGSEEIKVCQFQNSGIVCLETGEEPEGGNSWFIKWTLNPRIS